MHRSLFVALFMLSLIWGGSFFFIKILLNDFGPWSIVFLRSSFGFVTIAVIMLVTRKPFDFKKVAWVPMAFIALINTAIPFALIAFSETKVTSGMASVLNATTPLWTMIVGIIFFRAITNRSQWIGMFIAFVGIIVLLGFNPVSIISVDLVGFICMLTATLCYAFGSQFSKGLLKGMSMYQITFFTLFFCMLGSGLMTFLFESIALSNVLIPQNFGVLIGLGVFGSGIAYVLYYYMIQKGTPEFASMVTYLVPATAIIWGYTLLQEQVDWNLLIGLIFILSGVFMASRNSAHRVAVSKKLSN